MDRREAFNGKSESVLFSVRDTRDKAISVVSQVRITVTYVDRTNTDPTLTIFHEPKATDTRDGK